MDVLIIGGTGLISTKITDGLVDRGHDVTLYNRGETGAEIPGGVDAIHGNRTDHDRFEEQVADLDVDVVVDMWCMTRADAKSAVRAFEGRIDQYVFCSTVDVYEFPPRTYPITENHPLREPGEGYAAEKAGCERIFDDAHEDGAFAVTTLRPWYTYGEGRGIVTTIGGNYISRIRAGEPILVHGDGEAIWGACHRDDVARAFVAAVGNEDAYGEPYNVTGEEWVTWNRYYELVAEALVAAEPELVHVPTEVLLEAFPERSGGLERTFRYSQFYDTEKARADLDFEYTISWVEGVRRVVDWLDERGEIDPDERDEEIDRVIEAWRETEPEATEAVREYES